MYALYYTEGFYKVLDHLNWPSNMINQILMFNNSHNFLVSALQTTLEPFKIGRVRWAVRPCCIHNYPLSMETLNIYENALRF